MHLIQPAARLLGRLRSGLTPWRWRGARALGWPWPRTFRIWSEKWIAAEQRLRHLESILRWNSAIVRRGSDFDTWDLEVRGGLFGLARVRMTVEEHGNGRQLVRVSTSPCPAAFTLPLVIALLAFSIVAPLSPALTAFYLCDIIGAIILLLMLYDQSLAQGMVSRTLCNMEAK